MYMYMHTSSMIKSSCNKKIMGTKMATRCIAFEAVLVLVTVLVFLVTGVTSDDYEPVPADKSQLNEWFDRNVQAASWRKDLETAVGRAESKAPKIVYVKKDGSGDFQTIDEAIKSVPKDNMDRIVIAISGGNYTEKLKVDRGQRFVTLYGDPNDIPVIVFNGDAKTYGTTESSTLTVEASADYFVGANLKIVNTTPRPDGREAAQAVALRASGDKGAYYNVKMYGFQDTLCDDAGYHLFKDCYVEGTVDFIFGNAKSLYLNTEIQVLEGLTGVDVITAHANGDPNADVGYSFVHCNIEGNTTKAFLGRTWRTHPKVIYSYTEMADIIDPKGWWISNHQENANTAYFAEFRNSGPGSKLDSREGITKKLNEGDAKPFISLGYINASIWLLPMPKL